jgi:hypothetical protein
MSIGSRTVAVVGLALACALPARAADVTGKWKAEFDSQVGVQKYTFDFKAVGGKVTGKASFERMGEKGEVDLQDVKVTGDDISFTEPLEFQGTKIVVTYTGKVVGDEIKLTRNVGDFATEEIVAKRAKE